MSLFGMMRTGASGMNAQASRLGTVSDNIANANTTGYKKASTEFSSLLLPSVSGNYNSGAIQTQIRYGITQQGALEYTSSDTDLAINGGGFFVVQDKTGVPYLTRAGAFTPNADGELINAAGYKLLGYPYTETAPVPVVNGYNGLVPVTVGQSSLTAKESTRGTFVANLDSDATAETGTTPGTITAGNTPDGYTHKSSLKAYDTLGGSVLLDFYYTKTADDTWEIAVYNSADATDGGFPYSTDPLQIDGAASQTLNFNPATGKVTNADAEFEITGVTNMSGLTIDFSSMTQYAYDFTVQNATVNGTSPSQIERIKISDDGIVFAQYENGSLDPLYRLALASVPSPDELDVISGNIFAQGVDSGVVTIGFAGSGNFGTIVSGALESSNVDIAEELTTMIESQRSYTADSKVFQTGSDLMEILVNLKR